MIQAILYTLPDVDEAFDAVRTTITGPVGKGQGGWLKGVTDPNAKFVAFAYDAAGNVTRSWDRDATQGYTLSQFPGTVDSPTNGTYAETQRGVSNYNYLAGRLTNLNDPILVNSRQLTGDWPMAESGSASTIGTATGWGELYSQGNAAPWSALPTAPNPSAHGWLMDSTQLEGNTIQAGSWNVQMKLGLSTTGTVTADLHVRAWRYSSGVWTLIGDFTRTGGAGWRVSGQASVCCRSPMIAIAPPASNSPQRSIFMVRPRREG